MACNAERGLERLEAACTQKTFAQDQEAPTVADHRNRAGDRARLLFKGAPFHQRLQWPATSSPVNSNSELMRIQHDAGYLKRKIPEIVLTVPKQNYKPDPSSGPSGRSAAIGREACNGCSGQGRVPFRLRQSQCLSGRACAAAN